MERTISEGIGAREIEIRSGSDQFGSSVEFMRICRV
jgi:hypothetical protein